MAQKLLVGDKDTVLLLPAFEINGVPQMAYPTSPTPVPITAPTAALLNYYISATTPGSTGAHWGGNITCAVIDDWNLAMTDSATDDTRTLCSVGQSQDLTFYNYDAQMNFLRDLNPKDATSEFNLPLNLTIAPDVADVIAHRIGYGRTAAAAGGQEWHLYYVWTDHSVPAAADGSNQSIGQTFIPKGIVHLKVVLP
jgi:hypothetical protein